MTSGSKVLKELNAFQWLDKFTQYKILKLVILVILSRVGWVFDIK